MRCFQLEPTRQGHNHRALVRSQLELFTLKKAMDPAVLPIRTGDRLRSVTRRKLPEQVGEADLFLQRCMQTIERTPPGGSCAVYSNDVTSGGLHVHQIWSNLYFY